jgi:diguanylate cyclase (GGDEF)-like protein/PAS domain S-box-containing protein/putative nucleotidyltransferase with HDIG domain
MENKKIKILAIDNNRENLIVLKSLIQEKFPEAIVLTSPNSLQGLEIALAEDPDVIFLDITIPKMGGCNLCKKLKTDSKLRDIPVVFITDFNKEKEFRINALHNGADAFLNKPIDETELTIQILTMMKIRSANIQLRDEKALLATLVEEKIRDLQKSNREAQRLLDSVKKEQVFIEAIFDSIPGYLYVYDESGKLIRWNKKHETMTGYSSKELSQMTMEKWFDKEDMGKVNAAIHNIFTKGYGEVEAPLIMKSGEKMLIHSSGAPLIWDNHKYFTGIGMDITERKKLEIQLQHNMNDLLESQRIAHLGTWRLDLTTNQVMWSEELYKMYGVDSTLPPPPFEENRDFFTPESWEKLSKAIKQTRTSGIPYELELETVASKGKHGWMWVRGEAVRDSNGNITTLWGAAQDITVRKKTEMDLIYLSYHDHMTKLHNRRFFEEELMRLDIDENLPLSIIMCDVNGLKLVNDSFGHDLGDELLKNAAQTLKSACRKHDIVARVGGDEFVLVLPNTTASETENIANQLKNLASNEKIANIELSLSYGYETKTSDNQSIMEVVANAENHMYRHKLSERSSIRSKTIDLIMNTLFEKSSREAMHSNRVSFICESIALQMNFNTDAVNQMRIAGLIHDIGKIGVDEKILNKPGRLTVEERVDMERHPEIGWKILSSTNEFSELAQFVLNHHEKWDGSGYPNKIKGESIQIEARIISIADAYDAMTSERSYQVGMSHEDAIKELKRCSGTQFDPQIVDIFVTMAPPEIRANK